MSQGGRKPEPASFRSGLFSGRKGMDSKFIRDRFIVAKVPSGPVSGSHKRTMTKQKLLDKLETEFVRVSNEYYKEKSEFYEGYREGLSQALWLLKKLE